MTMDMSRVDDSSLGLVPPPASQSRWAEYERFGREVVAPRAAQQYDHHSFDRVAWKGLASLGFWRIAVPTAYGGDGGTWRDFADALQSLARTATDLGFLLSLIAHAGLLRGVLKFGTEAQKRRLVRQLIGGAVGATAITEPSGGSDISGIKTAAVADASGYRLTGLKQHITNAPVADLSLVVGRIPALGSRDITLFVLDLHAKGVSRGEPEVMSGNRTSPTGALMFDDVELGADAVLGEPGDGLAVLYNIISFDRVLYGLIAAAWLEPMLEDGIKFAHERRAFKAQLIDHEYVQGRITDMMVTIETTRAVSLRALDALIADRPDANLRCSMAKLVGTEGLVAATRNAMCLLGHRGYMDGVVSRAVHDALGTLIAGGTSEMQRKNILNQMLKLRSEGEVVR